MMKNQDYLKDFIMETVLRNVTLCDGAATYNSWTGELENMCTTKLLGCNIIINWVTESESLILLRFMGVSTGHNRTTLYFSSKMIISKLSTVVVLNARADLMLCII